MAENGDRPTERQMQLLALTAAGIRPRQMAQEIHVSYHTVRSEMAKVRETLDAATVSEAVAKAIFIGWIVQSEDGRPIVSDNHALQV